MKQFLAVILLLSLVLSLSSCGKKEQEDMNGNMNLNEDEMPDIKTDEEIPPENSGDEQDGHDLGIDDNPEIKPEGYIDPKKHINVYVTRKESEMEDGPDYFYYDTEYRYYFEKMQSPYTFISVDGAEYADVATVLASGLVSIEELEMEGLKICFELIKSEEDFEPQVQIDVIYTEDGILLGKGRFHGEAEDAEPHNIIVYSESASQHKKGDNLFITYTIEQLVKCETEEGDDPEIFTYKVLKENAPEDLPESYEDVKFVIEYKLVDAEIYTD